jgi:nucleotidyltransferase AbiEii toxin of type IV toxin-antitoxin system
MQARAFWKAVTVDRSNLLERFFELLRSRHVHFCLIGGQALNAYVEPVVSLDLDVVIAADRLAEVESLVTGEFQVEHFPHSLNVSDRASDLRIQIQLDPRYHPFLERATLRDVLGLRVPVAAIEDLLQGKVWAVQDPTRRGSKRQKDLADIARILEDYPQLRPGVDADILDRLV